MSTRFCSSFKDIYNIIYCSKNITLLWIWVTVVIVTILQLGHRPVSQNNARIVTYVFVYYIYLGMAMVTTI